MNQFFNYRNVKTHFHMRKTQSSKIYVKSGYRVPGYRGGSPTAATVVPPKFRGVPLGADPSCWGLQWANVPG